MISVVLVAEIFKDSAVFDNSDTFRAQRHRSVPRSTTLQEKDCGSRTCTMEIHFEAVCITYVDESDFVSCDFPCSKAHCTEEIHYSVDCPTWLCTEKTTTTEAPTPAPLTTPRPSHDNGCSSPACISSVTFNCLLILVVVALISLYLKLRQRLPSTSATEHGLSNPFFDEFVNTTPIIRSHSERLPLLPLSTSENQRSGQQFIQGLSQASRRTTSPTRSVALNSSAPDLPYYESNF